MKKWMYGVLYGLALAFVCVVIGYEILIEKNTGAGFLSKAALCVIALITAIVRTFFKPIHAPSNRRVLYRKHYAEFIGEAFLDDKKLEKRFFDALQSYNQKKYSAALGKLNKLQPQCQRTAERYAVTVFQALCCHDMQLYKDAVSYYQAALLTRRSAVLSSNMGLCHEKLGDYQAACDAYFQAAQIDPKNAVPYNNMAQIWMRLGDYEQAMAFARQALQRDQKMSSALNALAVSSYMLGNQADYERYYRQAVASGSDAAKLKTYIASLDPSL